MENKNEWNLRDYEKTLKEVSYDKNNKKYMTESQIRIICFDDFVTKKYVPKCKLKATLSSNDALYCFEEDRYIFIEFKNGRLVDKKNKNFKNEELRKLEKKNIDSMFILLDLTNKCFDELVKKTEYILVYNKENNDIESLQEIGSYFIKEGKSKAETETIDEIICFGLEKFKGYCFKSIHTYSKEEFEEKFVRKYEKLK